MGKIKKSIITKDQIAQVDGMIREIESGITEDLLCTSQEQAEQLRDYMVDRFNMLVDDIIETLKVEEVIKDKEYIFEYKVL